MKKICDVKNIIFGYSKNNLVLNDISFSVKKKEIVAILGKNGSGKSTLLNIIVGFIPDYSGSVFINDKNIKNISFSERAKNIAYIVQKQKNKIPGFYSVEEFVIEGRRPFRNFGMYIKEDYEFLNDILHQCNLTTLKSKSMEEISGGEIQRCIFARALMKQADLLLFDEPCSAMDIKYQKEFFNLAKKAKETHNSAVVITTHDINLAVQNCDRLVVFKDGCVLYDGDSSLVTEEVLSKAFDTEVTTEPIHPKNFYY
ncbi:MAG TPA: ABC transporter ATP-binding protein [Spirochaetota bacterium]|nr:ABC transporter ATP-binding protein [Spirochaetota bacterium]HOS32293.1 ABC transporter ATP-binding protein [Spirochaetota bacterium]HOS54693.1 ABC transporter ATP-binding protein [Spirochaetota bacterium]HQF77287.1 ABC transporter ATP-binding protein [Spirochaetota bacterium]HQH29363.1 ABC transporter ATP-binding protein [Spirochaetota bacterium]